MVEKIEKVAMIVLELDAEGMQACLWKRFTGGEK